MELSTSLALTLSAIFVGNALKNLIYVGVVPKLRSRFMPQLKFEAKFVPAMLALTWVIWLVEKKFWSVAAWMTRHQVGLLCAIGFGIIFVLLRVTQESVEADNELGWP